MKKQPGYFKLTLKIPILVGIILALALGVKDPALIVITLSSVWFFYAVLMLVTTFLIKLNLETTGGPKNGETMIKYELLNAGKKNE